jgi:hypothetical protein
MTERAPTLAEQIIAVNEAIGNERKGLVLLDMPALKDAVGEKSDCLRRTAGLEAAVATLQRVAAGTPPERASS